MKISIHILLLGCILVSFTACSKDAEYDPGNTNQTFKDSVISYFKEVALGYEFGNAPEVTRKWRTAMKLFVSGQKDTALMTELNKIITEINTLATDGFTIQTTMDSLLSNFYLFLGSGETYSIMFPHDSDLVKTNDGLFFTYYNGANQIFDGRMYVNLTRNTDVAAQKHILREELTQSLGLAKDSERNPESIFQQAWTTVTAYAPIDKELIKALYHPKMRTGLNAAAVDPVLQEIVP